MIRLPLAWYITRLKGLCIYTLGVTELWKQGQWTVPSQLSIFGELFLVFISGNLCCEGVVGTLRSPVIHMGVKGFKSVAGDVIGCCEFRKPYQLKGK